MAEDEVFEKASYKSVSLYPRHIEYVERLASLRRYPERVGFSRALQAIIDEHEHEGQSRLAELLYEVVNKDEEVKVED